MKKLISIILLLFFLATSFNSYATSQLPSCKQLKEELSEMESEIYGLYKILIEDEKFSSHGSLEKKFYGTNSLFIYWPTFDFRKDKYKPVSTPNSTRP